MGLGTSLFLIAVGAILNYAVTGHVAGVRIHTVGVIVMIVGVVGLLISLFYATIYERRSGRYRDDPPPPL